MYPQKIASELIRINDWWESRNYYGFEQKGEYVRFVKDLTYLFAERFDIPKTVRREVFNWIVGRNNDTPVTFAKHLLDRYFSDYTHLKGYDGD